MKWSRRCIPRLKMKTLLDRGLPAQRRTDARRQGALEDAARPVSGQGVEGRLGGESSHRAREGWFGHEFLTSMNHLGLISSKSVRVLDGK